MPTAFLVACHLLLASCSDVYTDSIPDTEYDFTICKRLFRSIDYDSLVGKLNVSQILLFSFSVSVDPNTAYGSPYGGFSRATASRLASMPLTLPNIDHEAVDFDPIYITTRDAAGRQYACRVYHEDELEPGTLEDSLFDKAILRRLDESDDARTTKDDSSSVSKAVESGTLSRSDDPIVIEKGLRERLRKLSQMCAQIHKGWWSYEW